MLNKLLCRVEPERKKEFEKLLRDAKPLLETLQGMLDKEFEKLEVIQDEDFDNPSWALKQAYKQGIKKGLTILRDYGII